MIRYWKITSTIEGWICECYGFQCLYYFFLSGNLPSKTKWICICDRWRLYRKWNLRWRTSYVKGEPSIFVFVIRRTFWSMNWLCSLFLFLSQALNWNLSPITINSWLNIYLQLSCLASKNGKTPNFHLPKYPQQQFIQVTQVCNVIFYEMQSMSYLLVPSVRSRWLDINVQQSWPNNLAQ